MVICVRLNRYSWYYTQFLFFWKPVNFFNEQLNTHIIGYFVRFKGKYLLIINEATHMSGTSYNSYDSPINIYWDTVHGCGQCRYIFCTIDRELFQLKDALNDFQCDLDQIVEFNYCFLVFLNAWTHWDGRYSFQDPHWFGKLVWRVNLGKKWEISMVHSKSRKCQHSLYMPRITWKFVKYWRCCFVSKFFTRSFACHLALHICH